MLVKEYETNHSCAYTAYLIFHFFRSPSMSFFNLSAVSFPFLSSYLRSGTKICFYVIKAFNGPIDRTLNGISIEYGTLIE